MSKINILIADDHKLIRETWSYILNSDSRFQVIAECGDAQEAVELAKTEDLSRIEGHRGIDAFSTRLRKENAANGCARLCDKEFLQGRNDKGHSGGQPR